MTTRPFLPYGRQVIDDDDVAAVVATLRSDWLTTGPAVRAFETALSGYLGTADAVSCSSGTAGLHLAAMSLGLGEGDVVIVPAITFVATANAIRYTGAEVAFSDVDPETGLMGPEQAEAAIANIASGQPRAIFSVHLAGQAGDPPGLQSLANRYGLAVVEDACHSLGTRYRTESEKNDIVVGACRHSDLAVFSFHPVKTIAMGEGGAVVGADNIRIERLRNLANHCIERNPLEFRNKSLGLCSDGSPNPWYYETKELGFNYRASDIHCALGLSQLRKLDRFIGQRQILVEEYDASLKSLAPLVRPMTKVINNTPAWHLYVVLIDFAGAGVERARIVHRLREEGIGCQVHYVPVHLQPYYAERYGQQSLPGAEAYYSQALTLPLFPSMTSEDISLVVAALRRALRE